MNATVFPVQYYSDDSDTFLVRYFEILHIVCMNVVDMTKKMSCVQCSERLYTRPSVVEKEDNTRKPTNTDMEESQSYRKLLQTSDVLLDSFRTISQCELAVLQTCSFVLLLCLIQNYEKTSEMLDLIFEGEDEWTYFSLKKNIKHMIQSIPIENIQMFLKRICTTKHPHNWIGSKIDNWIEVSGKNISSLLQLNKLPGGNILGSQRYICTVTSGPDKQYVGSIQILTHVDRPECMVMGILKHPIAEKECNNVAIYTGFVRTIFDTVAKTMKSIGKTLIWTFPLENMATIMKKAYGQKDQQMSQHIIHRFLVAMGLDANEIRSILRHPQGLFVYTCNDLIE
jgi:hypothetical protein